MRKMIYARLQFGCVDLCAARWFFFIFMRAGRPDDARPVIGGRDNKVNLGDKTGLKQVPSGRNGF